MSNDEWFYLGIVWFLGLTLGWCFRKHLIWGLICICMIAPVIQIIIVIDMWAVTGAFVFGVLIHTWKPLYERLRTL